MKRKVLLILSVILLSVVNSNGQSSDTFHCAFDTLYQMQTEANPKLKGLKQSILHKAQHFREKNPDLKFYAKPQLDTCSECFFMIIDPGCYKSRFALPVIVHIVHNPFDSIIGINSNIDSNQVKSAIVSLNKSFAAFGISDTTPAVNTGIQFFLAPVGPDGNGIIRYPDLYLTRPTPSQGVDLMDLVDSQYRNNSYIHLFVVDEIAPSSIKGYAFLPGKGLLPVVVARKRFGNRIDCPSCDLDMFSYGKTVAHELGHHLGLLHTFEGACAGMDSSDCHIKGDGCCDTPPVKVQNPGCPSSVNSCNETPDKNDQTENFMDYTDEDCSFWFTRNQAEIMYSELSTTLQELADIDWLASLNPDICLFSARFKSNNNLVCSSGTVNLRGIPYSNQGVDYRWTIYDTSHSIIFDTLIADYHQVDYFVNTLGKYHVRLQVIFQSDTAEEYVQNMIWVSECNTLQSEQANWYFGELAGLIFNETGETRPGLDAANPFNPTINTAEGCVSVSDSLGNLLFYGGGRESSPASGRFYNHLHDSLNHFISNSLNIHGLSAQSVVSLPCPFDDGKIMLIHSNANYSGPLYYTILDDTTTGVLKIKQGTRNTPVNLSGINRNSDSAIIIRESLTVAPKCDGNGYWLAVIAWHEDSYNYLTIISVDTNGFEVIDTSFIHNIIPSMHFGQAKFSPDASKIAVMNHVYDFDRSTGKLKYLHELPFYDYEINNIYGLSFSPNSRYLYWNAVEDDEQNAFIYRIDLSLQNPVNYIKKVGNAPKNNFYNAMQLGPDNKLYIANDGYSEIGVIKFPDKEWNDNEQNPLGYNPVGINLKAGNTGGISKHSLPNMIDAKKYGVLKDTIYYTISNCNIVNFSTNACCSENYLWIFGDGDTSHQKQVEHHYNSYGSYNVKLVLNNADTLYLDLVLVSPQIKISGIDTICNFNIPYFYQIIDSFSNSTDYIWEIDTGVIYPITAKSAYVDIVSTNTILRVSAYDHFRDCSASDSMYIFYSSGIDNNTITSHYNDYLIYYCPSETITNTGSTPTGGNNTFAYQWFVSYDSLSYQAIEGQTSKNLTFGLKDTSFFVLREVQSEGCVSKSNKVKYISNFKRNLIEYDECSNMDTIKLKGNYSPFIFMPNQTTFAQVFVSWTYKNNSFWDTINKYTIHDATDSVYYKNWKHVTTVDTSITYRRTYRVPRFGLSDCFYHSNEITIHNIDLDYDIELIHDSCDYSIESIKDLSNSNFPVKWLSSTDGETWDTLTATDPNLLEITSNLNEVHIKRVVLNPECPKESNVIIPVLFSITSHPSTYQASGLYDSANFEVAHSGGEGTQVQWQISIDGGENWTDIEGANNLNYKVSGDACNDDFQYRAKVFNECQTEFSDPATLIVDPGAGSDYFLWLRDLPSDTAAERNYQIHSTNYLFSPDIQPSYYYLPTAMNNPLYYSIGTISTAASIYIHTKIRNKGTDTSSGGKLYLYASRSGMHPEWNFSFTSELQFMSFGSINRTNINMGTEINDTGIYIPPIPPGGEQWITYYWTGVPSYLTGHGVRLWSTDYMFDRKKVLIYLARIETCENEPYGMTYPEVKYNSSTYRTAFQNIRNNARIAALHSELTPMKPQRDAQNVLDRMPDKWNTVESDPYNRPYKLVMNSDSTKNFFNDGEVYIYFDDNMWDAWLNGGSRGSGFVVVEDNVFKISALQPVYWDSMTLAQDSIGYIGYSLHYKPAAPMTGGMQHEFFRFSLHTDTFELGEFWLHTEIQTGMEGSAFNGDDANDATSLDEVQSTPLVFSARPNPFSNELKVFVANFDAGSRVTMFDMNGKQLFSQSLNNKNTEQVLTFKTAHLAEGVYYVHYRSENQNMVRKIVLVR